MRTIFVSLAIIVVGFVVIYLQSPNLTTQISQQVESVCDFQQSLCKISRSNIDYVLDADPKVIKSETEVQFRLSSAAFADDVSITGHLEGKTMYMGKIPLFFNYQNGAFVADTMIGACTEDSMVWMMIVKVDDGQGNVTAFSFDFTSYQ
ncbi:hypothetical protein E2K93_16450 [Thalassotalea sp. HSM 43]|uniref:hypothetical protein n=1 Tax=Thalassotalea sp. HSM 43 TaxID=2552945 RepID=UPI0010816F6C|nr:hypothetical protein [Thalassotalea sp. HSM 43]QBY05857.1 hypothetical protein E2K93_16450 [Thalassotalea sp. HSM 43]